MINNKVKLLILGGLFIILDFFGSIFLIAGKSPQQILSFSAPKISITPFPTMIFQPENISSTPIIDFNNVNSSSLSPINDVQVTSKANSIDVNISYKSIPNPDPLLELFFIVRDDKEYECAFQKYGLDKGWIQAVTLSINSGCQIPSKLIVALKKKTDKTYLKIIKKDLIQQQ